MRQRDQRNKVTFVHCLKVTFLDKIILLIGDSRVLDKEMGKPMLPVRKC